MPSSIIIDMYTQGAYNIGIAKYNNVMSLFRLTRKFQVSYQHLSHVMLQVHKRDRYNVCPFIGRLPAEISNLYAYA